MALQDYLKLENIIPDFNASTKEEALEALVAHAVKFCPALNAAATLEVLQERESLGSTGIGEGVAIPHGKVEGCDGITVVLARSLHGCDFNAVDGRKCHIFCMLLAPSKAAAIHLSVLAHFVRVFKTREFRTRFNEAADAKAIWSLLSSTWKD
ncbi:PTS sugar transporter subunit IIA [Desulfovibrio sp. OttesenSCG-928-F07]|nr:PTS sugar transporter subunit IIA [Desulfovibrio sp. OttesenSCG-928-F07]